MNPHPSSTNRRTLPLPIVLTRPDMKDKAISPPPLKEKLESEIPYIDSATSPKLTAPACLSRAQIINHRHLQDPR
jgi:hypothetical protein